MKGMSDPDSHVNHDHHSFTDTIQQTLSRCTPESDNQATYTLGLAEALPGQLHIRSPLPFTIVSPSVILDDQLAAGRITYPELASQQFVSLLYFLVSSPLSRPGSRWFKRSCSIGAAAKCLQSSKFTSKVF